MRVFAAAVLVIVSGTSPAGAQKTAAASPFLFASLALAPNGRVVTSLDTGYNERAFEPSKAAASAAGYRRSQAEAADARTLDIRLTGGC